MSTPNIYEISVKTLDGKQLNWEEFKGKKILIVNVASECGYTPQYATLQELYEKYSEELIILGVPCNDFGAQEPGNAEEIQTFCSLKYKVTFPMTEKVGIVSNTHPLYQWLTQKEKNGKSDNEVKWNFHKFLINEKGELERSYKSGVEPLSDEITNWVKG